MSFQGIRGVLQPKAVVFRVLSGVQGSGYKGSGQSI